MGLLNLFYFTTEYSVTTTESYNWSALLFLQSTQIQLY